MTTVPGKTLRDGNAAKRATILNAARELFLRDGVARTSMDGVASAAGASKRTVYDYFGDKSTLLTAVIESAGESLLTSLQQASDAHLSDEADIRTLADLERALTQFAVEIGTTIIASDDYATVVTLIRENNALLPQLERHELSDAPERMLADRIRHFAKTGLLDAPDADLAAEHFKALTLLLANERPAAGRATAADTAAVNAIMSDGTRAFLRAYRR